MHRSPRSLADVVAADLCVSCGACVSCAPAGSMRMTLDHARGIFLPSITDPASVSGSGPEFACCPGKGVDYARLSRTLFGGVPPGGEATFALGRYCRLLAARANDERYRREASSGGVMTAIAAGLLSNGTVDGVLVSCFVYGPEGPRTQTVIARTEDELMRGQGSKYCPTTTNSRVADCLREGGRYLFIGTPCQVAALRMAAETLPAIHHAFPLTMANFCGGYRDFRDLDHLIRRHGIAPGQVCSFRFRGGGQPGSMRIRTQEGREVIENYPDYGRHSAYPKLPRCVFCTDATGELADIACGDAWFPRLQQRPEAWSVVILRSPAALALFEQLAAQGRFTLDTTTPEEVIASQWTNIESKKYRQRKRRAVYALVGRMLPRYDGTLPSGSGSYWREARTALGKWRRARRMRRAQTTAVKRSSTPG